jgi:hypothetical protein
VLFELDLLWLVMAFAGAGVFAFMFGSALDGLTGSDGFGAVGNMFVLMLGFFGGIYAANELGYSFDTLMIACGVGLGGAFLSFSAFALIKAGLRL